MIQDQKYSSPRRTSTSGKRRLCPNGHPTRKKDGMKTEKYCQHKSYMFEGSRERRPQSSLGREKTIKTTWSTSSFAGGGKKQQTGNYDVMAPSTRNAFAPHPQYILAVTKRDILMPSSSSSTNRTTICHKKAGSRQHFHVA